jgi:hypothetical protein
MFLCFAITLVRFSIRVFKVVLVRNRGRVDSEALQAFDYAFEFLFYLGFCRINVLTWMISKATNEFLVKRKYNYIAGLFLFYLFHTIFSSRLQPNPDKGSNLKRPLHEMSH